MFTMGNGGTFLNRMRRDEGIAPKVSQKTTIRLGTTSERLYELSLCVSLFFAIVSFKFFPFQVQKQQIATATRENVTVEDVVQTRQENRPPPPPRPPIPIEAPEAEVLEDIDITSTEIDLAEDVAPPPTPTADDNEDSYFVVVEDLPQLIGGYEGLMKRIVYPQIALRAGIQGRVYLMAYVNESGGVDRVELIRGLSGGLNEAAIEAVKQSSFTPGKQRGRPVKVKIALTVNFRISGTTS